MKFKYNLIENKLGRIEEEYSYEVTENNFFHLSPGKYSIDGFYLGEKEGITFDFSHFSLKVHYQKANIAYQKTLDLLNTREVIFEFTEQDRINSS